MQSSNHAARMRLAMAAPAALGAILIASAVQAQSPTGTSPAGSTATAGGGNFTGSFVAANGSGVSGTASLAVSGDNLTIQVNASGLDPETRHEMHIHLGPTCPGEPPTTGSGSGSSATGTSAAGSGSGSSATGTSSAGSGSGSSATGTSSAGSGSGSSATGTSAAGSGSGSSATGTSSAGSGASGTRANAADTNGDGFVDIVEAMAAGGDVLLPLDDDPSNQDMDTFGRSDSSGRLTYSETVPLKDVMDAISGTDDDADDHIAKISGSSADWASYIVEIHGVADDTSLPDTVQTEDGKSKQETLPVACANLASGSAGATSTTQPSTGATATGTSTAGGTGTIGGPGTSATGTSTAASGSSATASPSASSTSGAQSAATPSATSAAGSSSATPSATSSAGSSGSTPSATGTTGTAGSAGSGANPTAPDSGTGIAEAAGGTSPLIALGAAFMAASLGLLGLSSRKR